MTSLLTKIYLAGICIFLITGTNLENRIGWTQRHVLECSVTAKHKSTFQIDITRELKKYLTLQAPQLIWMRWALFLFSSLFHWTLFGIQKILGIWNKFFIKEHQLTEWLSISSFCTVQGTEEPLPSHFRYAPYGYTRNDTVCSRPYMSFWNRTLWICYIK